MGSNRANALTTWAGCTYRQYDHWVRLGLVPGLDKTTGGSGQYRVWRGKPGAARALSFLTAAAPCTRDMATLDGPAKAAAGVRPGQVITWWPQARSWSVNSSMESAGQELYGMLADGTIHPGWMLLWECPADLPEGVTG